MNDLSPLETEASKGQRRSSVLLIFLIFPLVGLLAAAALIVSSSKSAAVIPTPAPVTMPPPPTPTVDVLGSPAPDFHLQSLDGQTVRLSDFGGRIVFLNFWATWCEPCKRELPAFQAFMQNQPADGPVVLAVDVMENSDTVTTFLNQLGVSGFPILLDSNHEVADAYGVAPIPVTFVINQQGIISYPKYGEMKLEDLESYVQTLSG
jgi:peroxiredoxin